MTSTAAVMASTYQGDGPSDLVTAAAVVGLIITLIVMVLADWLRKADAADRAT